MQRSRFGPEIALKEARLATLQRVSAERFARTAPLKEQAAGTKALLQAQMQSLRDWGFASDEDLASAAAYLPRLHSDPMLTGCLAYAVYPYGSRILGSAQGLSMQGLGIAPEHCEIFDTGGGLWLKHLAPGRYRLCLNDKMLDGTTPEPLTNGDRLQLGWAHELLVVTDERSEMCPEVRKDPATRPMASLIDEANELAKELDHLQIASQESKFFEVVDSLPPSMTLSAATQEPLIRLRHRSQVMEDAVTVWPVSDFRSEVKRMRDLFRAPPPTCSAAGSKVLDVEEGQSGAESRDDAGSMTKIELHKEANISSPGPASPEDCSILSSLQRARSLSQNIGDTVFALQDTVAELKRTAASARAVPMEVLTKLREDCAEMKSRLERLETRAGQAQAQDATRHRAMALAPQHRDSALPTQRRYSMPAPVTVRPCAVQAWRGPSQPIRHTFSEPTSRAAWLSRDASCQRIAYSLTASAARGRRCSSPGAQRSPLVVQVPGSVVSYNLHGMLANGMVSPKNVRTPFIAQLYVRP
ncbi:Kif13a [Symbiodinium necroappetens]|uniref:Kif13a protein n=1 Tax=Symbiodinium necroappetens TaxID=1628268 RepID=A0A813A3U6_9DINO|nr:Kif13a [Symbiodinium necroappetens]